MDCLGFEEYINMQTDDYYGLLDVDDKRSSIMVQMVDEHLFAQKRKGTMIRDWLFFNSQCRCDMLCNPSYTTNILKALHMIHVNWNAKTSSCDILANLVLFERWYKLLGNVNVLSLKKVAAWYKVTYDSSNHGRMFKVHLPGGTVEFVSKWIRFALLWPWWSRKPNSAPCEQQQHHQQKQQ